VCRDVLQPSLRVTAARSAEVGNSRAACPPVNGAANLILRHAPSLIFPIIAGKFAFRRNFNSPASQFLDYELLLMRARVRETVSNRPKRGSKMSILKKLREQTRPLGVKEIAELFDVSEATIQRWVRRGEIPAIRVSDTIRFDPGVLADWIEQLSPMSLNQRRGTAGMEDSNA
jgi:excisionase family DNA binding protein